MRVLLKALQASAVRLAQMIASCDVSHRVTLTLAGQIRRSQTAVVGAPFTAFVGRNTGATTGPAISA